MNGKSLLIRIGVIVGTISVIAIAITLACKALGTEPNFAGGLAGGFMGGLSVGEAFGRMRAAGKL